jgi:hypothetical protein
VGATDAYLAKPINPECTPMDANGRNLCRECVMELLS